MTFPVRFLTLALLLLGTEWLTACSKAADSAPQPQAQAQTGAAVGQAMPAAALTSATATPTGGGTAYPATVNPATGQYSFAGLPVGSYTVTYAVAAGYAAPTAQVVTVTANATATLPALTLLFDRTALLTGRNWIVVSETVSPGISIGGSVITDLYSLLQPCDKDDFVRFETPNVYREDQGATKCLQSDPQVTTGVWVFNAAHTVLTVTPQGSGPQSLNIVDLTDTMLKITTSQTSNNINYTFTVTYRKG